jgi:hypothetical protein
MLDEVFPIPMNNRIARLASIVILLGTATIEFIGWWVLGWALVIYGILSLWLAHLIAVAPTIVEPTDTADRADS